MTQKERKIRDGECLDCPKKALEGHRTCREHLAIVNEDSAMRHALHAAKRQRARMHMRLFAERLAQGRA